MSLCSSTKNGMVAFNALQTVLENIQIVFARMVYMERRIRLVLNAPTIPKVSLPIFSWMILWNIAPLIGVYPNCECNDEQIFSAYINKCYVECGENSTGLHPHCICDNEDDFYYDVDSKKCESIIGRPCPEDSIGIGPDCLCINESQVFLLSLWECHYEYLGSLFMPDTTCPNRAQKWPQCDVSIDQKVLITLIGWFNHKVFK